MEQSTNLLQSMFYFPKDLRAMLKTYLMYRDYVPSALSAILYEPRHIIDFLSVFVQLSSKHLQRLVANNTLELTAFSKACSNATNERPCYSPS